MGARDTMAKRGTMWVCLKWALMCYLLSGAADLGNQHGVDGASLNPEDKNP